MDSKVEFLKSKLVSKAVRNVRKGLEKDEAGRGIYRPEVKLDLTRSRLLTESYKATEGESMVIRRAKAFENIVTKMDIYIQDWEKIVGNHTAIPEGLHYAIDQIRQTIIRMVSGEEGHRLLDDAGRAELAELCEYWKGKSMSDRHKQMFTGNTLGKYWKYEGSFLWLHWHESGVPNYEKIFQIGLKGIIEEAENRLIEIDHEVPLDYIDQKEFLKAALISLKATVRFANRYSEKAVEMAAKASDTEDKKRLEEIAKRCKWVPENPPRSLLEALQSFFLIHLMRYIEFNTWGIGVRFDKLFGPYYEEDLKEGKITRDDALELMQLLWVKFNELGLVYSPTVTGAVGGMASVAAITIGGVDEKGNDITNEMTYLVLDTARTMRTLEPSICLRYHDDTPDELLSEATDVIRTGIGYPSLFNDKVNVPTLQKWGVPLEDALDYSFSGCVYTEIPGKNIVRRVLGVILFPKCLWWALHQGISPKTGEQWGALTPDPRTFKSAEELMDAYLKQVRFFCGKMVTIENTCRSLYEKYLPRPFLSALLDGCIEKGKESRQWAYPSMIHDFIIMVGLANVSDSITAIKKVVFEDKKISIDELIRALDNNWEGFEDIRQMMIQAPKYGNDDDFADEITAEVHHRTSEVLAEFTDRFGNRMRGDGSGSAATYGLAHDTPATPDGRKDGDPFADSTLAPIQGGDHRGPTAVLKSASKISTEKTYVHILNQKFAPSVLEGDMKQAFLSYLRTWADLGISQIQFNVVDRKALLAAQENPEDCKDLIVRVAGYSAYFVDLSKGLQDSIIKRTEQSFG